MHPNQIGRNGEARCWKGAAGLFGADRGETKAKRRCRLEGASRQDRRELTLENDFLEGALTKAGLVERKAMIDREHDLPISPAGRGARRQPRLPVYYKLPPTSAEDLRTMRRLDELHPRLPVCGQPDAARLPEPGGRLDRQASRGEPDEAHRDRSHLSPSEHQQTRARPQDLPLLAAQVEDRERADQAWAMDITYIPMARGFVYLVAAVVDVFSRRVLAHRRSRWKPTSASKRWRRPWPGMASRTSSTATRGSQFTSVDFTGVLLKHGVAISMDGRGFWRDNGFVERLWRSVKYEEVYLRAYDSVSEARSSIGRYLAFYNHGFRSHSSLDRRTPDEGPYSTPSPLAAAA